MLGSKATLEGRTHLPRMEEDSEILEPEEIEALVEHLPARDDGLLGKIVPYISWVLVLWSLSCPEPSPFWLEAKPEL